MPPPDRTHSWDLFAGMMRAHPGCGAHQRDDGIWTARGDSGPPVEASSLLELSNKLDKS